MSKEHQGGSYEYHPTRRPNDPPHSDLVPGFSIKKDKKFKEKN